MKSKKVTFVLLFLIVGLLAACGSQPTATQSPASDPTDTAAPATDAPTKAPSATEPPTTAATEAPAATEVTAGGSTVSFAADILPLFQNRCGSCHGGDRTEEGLSLMNHAAVMTGSENGPVVTPGDAANSLLAQLVAEGKMPKRGPKLTPDQVQLINDWINQGALDN